MKKTTATTNNETTNNETRNAAPNHNVRLHRAEMSVVKLSRTFKPQLPLTFGNLDRIAFRFGSGSKEYTIQETAKVNGKRTFAIYFAAKLAALPHRFATVLLRACADAEYFLQDENGNALSKSWNKAKGEILAEVGKREGLTYKPKNQAVFTQKDSEIEETLKGFYRAAEPFNGIADLLEKKSLKQIDKENGGTDKDPKGQKNDPAPKNDPAKEAPKSDASPVEIMNFMIATYGIAKAKQVAEIMLTQEVAA